MKNRNSDFFPGSCKPKALNLLLDPIDLKPPFLQEWRKEKQRGTTSELRVQGSGCV